MQHRHLTHQNFTAAAIDDCIANGRLADWHELRDALHQDPGTLKDKILRICLAHIKDPYAQRYHLWKNYVERYFT